MSIVSLSVIYYHACTHRHKHIHGSTCKNSRNQSPLSRLLSHVHAPLYHFSKLASMALCLPYTCTRKHTSNICTNSLLRRTEPSLFPITLSHVHAFSRLASSAPCLLSAAKLPLRRVWPGSGCLLPAWLCHQNLWALSTY